MSSDLESIEHSSSSCSIEDKLPSTNNLLRGKEGQYAVGKKLAQGRYGAVYEVLRKSDGKPFACKLEICEVHSHGLDMDYTLMHQAAKRGCNHLLRMVDRGKIEEHFKFIIMPLLGDNLMKLRHQFVDGRFSLSTGLRLGLIALASIQELHGIGFVHRDIKIVNKLLLIHLYSFPASNFCLSSAGSSSVETKLVLIDYGVCRSFRDRNGQMKTPREDAPFRGTARYASLAAHRGEDQSPKDDVESWYYMMIEWMSGYLPWSECSRDDRDAVYRIKDHCRTDEGSAILLKFCPRVEFRRIHKYIDGLSYHNHPDYTFIAELVQLAMKNNGVKMDEPWDWAATE